MESDKLSNRCCTNTNLMNMHYLNIVLCIHRFYPYKDIKTAAILSLDDDVSILTVDEIEFGYKVDIVLLDTHHLYSHCSV